MAAGAKTMCKQESALYWCLQRSERVVSEGDKEKMTAVNPNDEEHQEGKEGRVRTS